MNHRCCNLLFYTQTGNTNTFTMPDLRVVHCCGHLGVNFIQIHTGGSIEMTRLCALSFSPNPPGLSFFFFFFFSRSQVFHTPEAPDCTSHSTHFSSALVLLTSSYPASALPRQCGLIIWLFVLGLVNKTCHSCRLQAPQLTGGCSVLKPAVGSTSGRTVVFDTAFTVCDTAETSLTCCWWRGGSSCVITKTSPALFIGMRWRRWWWAHFFFSSYPLRQLFVLSGMKIFKELNVETRISIFNKTKVKSVH